MVKNSAEQLKCDVNRKAFIGISHSKVVYEWGVDRNDAER